MATDDRSRYTLRDGVLWRRLESEIVILDGGSWTYLGLNDAGTLLWERLAEGATSEELAEVLADAYSLAPELARTDTDAFLSSLLSRNLLA